MFVERDGRWTRTPSEHFKDCGYCTKTTIADDLNPEEADEGWAVDATEVDPYFFDDGYTLAAATGFARVWEGAETLSRFLQTERGRLDPGVRVVELGAGVGACGLIAACGGAHVALTDVAPVVEDVVRRNIAQNALGEATERAAWPNAFRVGCGSATRATLDWTSPIPDRPFGALDASSLYDADVLIAAECVWLRDLVAPFVDTASTLLKGGVGKLILCVRDRSTSDDPASGKAFAHTSEVIRAFTTAGCVVEELHREDSREDFGKEIFIFSVRAAARRERDEAS
ncbi:hypothetical protein BE221DRAFT_175630 [Ostreococcus tauri]|uniref:Nicotinamide N-methyltransferase-like n=1 Tax=Ostreococcus tauri TaxID=70448 RepID=A0A1Y5I429_OSTTA|nr:hypothetical protein BE221DRAFT_175630 [Ostreococcus tauri]